MVENGFESRIKIQNIIENHLPEFILDESPKTVDFLRQYYISQEYQGGPVDLIENLDEYLKVDNLTPEVIVGFTSLTSYISETETTIPVISTKGFPSKYGLIKIDDEIITYTGITTNTFTGCIRGFSGVTDYNGGLDNRDLIFSTSNSTPHNQFTSAQNLSSLFLQEFFKKIKYSLTPGLENKDFTPNLNVGNFIKEARSLYESKGTNESFRILFNVLFGETPTVIDLEKFLIKPSSANYIRRKVVIADAISGNPLKLVGQTIRKNNDEKTTAAVSEVEMISRRGKIYYKILLFVGYDDSFPTITGNFTITGSTKNINYVSVGSSVITVDSTIGFPPSGKIYYEDNQISYTSKSINQFFGCSGVGTGGIPVASIIRSNDIYYGYEDGDITKKVELRFTGALSNYKTKSRNAPISVGEKISIKSLGEIIDNPTTGNKTYKEIFANSWIYNTSSRYRIDSFGPGVVSQFTLKDDIDKSSLKVGDYIDILDVNSQLILKPNLRIQSISGKQITVNEGFDFNESFDYAIRRRIKTASSSFVPLEFESITSDVQNVYNEEDEFMYVASNSLPSYEIERTISSYNALRPAGKNEETQSYSIIEFNGQVSFLTGSRVYYSYTEDPIPGLSEGVYYVEVVPDSGKTQIRLYSSKTSIETSNFLYFNNTEYVIKICDDNSSPVDAFPPGIHNFTLLSQKEKIISAQKILRKFPLNVNIGDGKSDLTEAGSVGMLINGVEILSYKSNNKIYYGPLDSVNVLNGGTGYDVINPPLLTISSGNALIQPVIRGSVEKIYVNPQEFDLNTVVSVAFTGGNGSGASFKPVIEKRRREIQFDARLLESSAGGVDVINETITFKTKHGLKDCDPIIYRPGNNPSIGIADFKGFNIDTGKTLKDGTTYYARIVSDKTIQLYDSLYDCRVGINTIGFTVVGTSGVQKFLTEPKLTLKEIKVLNGGSGYENRKLRVLPSEISTYNNSISYKNHGFKDGELVVYQYETTAISGLTTTNQYYIIKVDDNSFKLSDAGIGGTYKSNYERGKVVSLKTSGSGYQIFNYPAISLSVEYTTSGIGTTDFRGNILATPVVRGNIVDVFLYDKGSDYGSTIINFHKKPYINIKNGKEAQLKPVIINGKIEKVSIQYRGREYYSDPDVKVYGTGVGAVLKPVVVNKRIVDVIVINKGSGYSSSNTTLIVESSGKNAIFNCNVRALEINNNFLYNDLNNFLATNEVIKNSYNKLQYFVSGYSQLVQDEFNEVQNVHSPIIGWAYDGNPIYGSYGYSNPKSANSSVKLLKSGYSVSDFYISNRPPTYDLQVGFFVDDYKFTNSGDLDECNGRFCVTPEFPNGVYAYFATSIVDLENNVVGSFPYFIGNRYRSKFITENKFLNQDFDFNNSNLIRNTFPYKINEKYADNDFIVESNEIINQITVVESVFDDSIDGFEIIDGGDNYKVGDSLIFNEEKTKGGGLISQVSEVTNSNVDKIETSVIEYFDALFTWEDKKNIKVKIYPRHVFNDLDYVNISGFSSNLKFINGSYPIGVTSYNSLLIDEIDTYWNTGDITDIYVSGVPENISIGSSIVIRNEPFRILNVFEGNILRVRRYTPGYWDIDLISDIFLEEIPLGVSIGSTITVDGEDYVVLDIIEQDNILKVGNLTKGTSHSIGNIVKFDPDSFLIPKELDYFESKENDIICFNPNQSIGVGTSGGGVGVAVTYKIGKNENTIFIPTQSIYLPNHPFKNNQKLILKKPSDADTIFVSNNSNDVLFNGVFELMKNNTEQVVYVINKTQDYIGIVTQVGLTTTTNGLFFHSNGSDNYEYYFESDYTQVTGNVKKIETTIITNNSHDLEDNDLINLTVNPNISAGIKTDTSVRVIYDFLTDKLVINPISFSFSGIDTTKNQITIPNHNLTTGEKIIHRFNFSGPPESNYYYVYKVDDDIIQLCETFKDSTLKTPLVVNLISFQLSSNHKILPINPPLYPIKNNTLVFDLTDISLSGHRFKLFYDNDFYDEFVSTGTTNTFSVIGVGTIGVSTNASLSVKYNGDLNYSLYYSLEDINDANKKVYDKEVEHYSKITFINSLYNNSYNIKKVGINSFTVSLSKIPEKYSYLRSECDIIKYSTNSKTANGSISKIRIISPGFNFKSPPIFEKVDSEFGDGAYIIPISENIGKINQIRILNEGFEYSPDKTLSPEASIAKFLTIKNTNTIKSIQVIDGGKDYLSPPDLIVVNPLNRQKIDSGILISNLRLTSIFSVIIEEPPKGLPEKIVDIIAINNTNGVKIQKVELLSSGNALCTLVTPLSGFGNEPFSVGDKIFVEGIKKGFSGSGFNSEDYGYQFFTVVDYLNGGTSTARKLEFNLSEFTSNPGTPAQIGNIYANIVNYKKYPKFLVNQEFSDFIIGEILEVDIGFGFNGFNPENLKVVESNKNYIKVTEDFDLDINYRIRGTESGSVATITKIKESKGYFEVDFASFQKIGWSDNIGILDEDIQVISDNDYYQNLSYSIKSNQEWEDIVSPVNNIIHPSGLKNFADTQVTNNADTGDFIGTDRSISIYDIKEEHRVDTINNFDLTLDVDIDTVKNHSKYLKFKNKKLTDYVECLTNRVLDIDDISSEFSTSFGSTFRLVDEINASKRFERYLIQASNRRTSEIQLTELMILSDDFSEETFTFERGTITTGFSTDVGYNANSSGNFYGYVDDDQNYYLRFDPSDPYNNSYDIKFLNTSFTNSIPGIGTTSVGFVSLIGNTVVINPGATSTLVREIKTKLESAYLQVHIVDNVTLEMNYAEIFMDHDGTNTNISEFYSDTSEFFNSNPIGVFGSSLNGQIVDVYLTNTSSNPITVRTRNVGFGSTSQSSGIGTYIFKSLDQPSGTEKTFKYESLYSNVSSASTIISFNSSNISSLKSTITVSIGNTSALHQVMLVTDVTNSYITQYPFLSIGSTSGIGTFGSQINGSTVSLVFYPDASFSGNFKILSFNESFYSKADYINSPEILTYSNIAERYGIVKYLAINDPEINKLDFELKHKGTPIFMKTFNPSDSNILDLQSNILTIPNHFFTTGEKLIYRDNSSFEEFVSSPISIASTLNVSGIVTNILPSTVYAIKIDNDHLKIATRKEYATANPAIAVSFTSTGSGNAHELEMADKNTKTIISIDNIIQSPISYKLLTHTVNNGGPVGPSTTIFGLSGISSIFLNDVIKIDDEYMKVTNVGLGTTFSGPIIHNGNIPLLQVRRGFVGSSATEHSNFSNIKVYKGSYNIEKNNIYFTEAPTGDLSDELYFDYDNLEEARSYFNGRVFLRSDYSTNVIFDDISTKFTGIGQTFALTVGGENTVGLGNSGENGIVLINGIFQSPETEKDSYNNYKIVEDSISPPRSSIVFTGVRNSIDELIIDDSDVNRNQIPRGGIIISLGSTPGLGYAPLVGASVTAVSVGGTITSIGIGTSGSWGSGYRNPVFVEVYDPLHIGSAATITASVGAGGTLSFNVTFGGSGYANPIVNVSSPSYNNLPVTGVSRIAVGSTTETGKGLLLNLRVGASSTVGIGSTLFSVTDFEIVRNGYGFIPGDVFKPVGLVTGYGLSQPLEEFNLTVLDTFTDSFSAWQFGQLDHIDNIKVYQNGVKKRFPLYYNSQLLSFHINPSNSDSQKIDLNQLLLIFVNGVLQEPGVAYEFNGGTSFTFSEAPKVDDDIDIYFYRGSQYDSELMNITETIKDGDLVKVYSNNLNLVTVVGFNTIGITTTQGSRVVTDITTSDRLETELYTFEGIDVNNYKPLSWTKQKADKIINGQIVSKARDSLEVQVYPTAKIIRSFSSTDNAIFVDDAQFFNYERPEAINFDGLIVSGKVDPVPATVTSVVSFGGTIQSLTIVNPGSGYTGSSVIAKIEAPEKIGVGVGTTATAIITVSSNGSLTTPITITNPGFGYSLSKRPKVIIPSPDPVHETVTEVTSVQGFSGKIIGIQTVSGIGVPLALRFTMDPFLAPFPGLKVGNPIYIFNTSVGNGVRSIINSDSNIVGIGTKFLDNIYHISALQFSPEENTMTCNVHSQSSIVGIATSGFHVGDFSWGRLGGFGRSLDPIAIGVSGYTVDAGLSTFPTIQRRGFGLRDIGPIKKEGISYERDVVYRFIDDSSGLLCFESSSSGSISITGNLYATTPPQTLTVFSEITDSNGVYSDLDGNLYSSDLNGNVYAVTYTWFSSSSNILSPSLADDGDIVGTGTSYTITSNDIGKRISVRASYIDTNGNVKVLVSPLTSVVIQPTVVTITETVNNYEEEYLCSSPTSCSGSIVRSELISTNTNTYVVPYSQYILRTTGGPGGLYGPGGPCDTYSYTIVPAGNGLFVDRLYFNSGLRGIGGPVVINHCPGSPFSCIVCTGNYVSSWQTYSSSITYS